jgi:hypothetical protein
MMRKLIKGLLIVGALSFTFIGDGVQNQVNPSGNLQLLSASEKHPDPTASSISVFLAYEKHPDPTAKSQPFLIAYEKHPDPTAKSPTRG